MTTRPTGAHHLPPEPTIVEQGQPQQGFIASTTDNGVLEAAVDRDGTAGFDPSSLDRPMEDIRPQLPARKPHPTAIVDARAIATAACHAFLITTCAITAVAIPGDLLQGFTGALTVALQQVVFHGIETLTRPLVGGWPRIGQTEERGDQVIDPQVSQGHL
jgi:hypothetical protein